MEALVEKKCRASELIKGYKSYPQVLVNVPVGNKREILSAIEDEINTVRNSLGVRLLVRPSGTEEVIRILAESESYENCVCACGRIREVIDGARGRICAE